MAAADTPGASRNGPSPRRTDQCRHSPRITAETGLRRAALPSLQGLVERHGETGHLAILEGTEAVTVEVVDGWQTVRMHSWVGKRSPAHCSSMGKSLLAGLDAGHLQTIYPDPRLEARTRRPSPTAPTWNDSWPRYGTGATW